MDRIIPKSQIGIWIIPGLAMEGTTLIGDDTAFSKDLIVYGGEGENAFLTSTKDVATNYSPLPSSGWIEAGKIYSYQSRFVICRQSHERTIYPPEQTPALFAVYRANASDTLDWVAGEKVEKDMVRLYATKKYICLQGHQTQEDWTPDKTSVLWKEIIEQPTTYPAWVQPTGAHDAYQIGDKVTFNGHLWESKINANVWSPTVYPAGWLDLGVYP